MTNKNVFMFANANGNDKAKFGGKGANLAKMVNLGLPIPEGFIVTTEACLRYYKEGQVIADDVITEIFSKVSALQEETGKKFGDVNDPLLVSVRSGARSSMPGMMDTVLNLGMNDDVAETISKNTNNPVFAYDSYRRFIQMYSDVVMGIDKSKFESILRVIKEQNGVKNDMELTADNFKEVVKLYKELYLAEVKVEFPTDPRKQLIAAIKAVFKSWNNQRAIVYRKLNNIPDSWGTAVTIQRMVFGNMGNNSGTGVAFTRNPSTGEKRLYGEFLINAQGEDVVAGIRTPNPISDLEKIMPEVYSEFLTIVDLLENYFRDMQDMEFTIENKKLYMLQTRNGKRTAAAALEIATSLVAEGMISEEEAVMRIEPNQLDQLLHPVFDSKALENAEVIAKGLNASPGAATGKICFHSEDVVKLVKSGEEKVILIRHETSPEDIEGMSASTGILTGCGGMTSHAAVVARGMGRCCIAGCSQIRIFEDEKYFIDANGNKHYEGDYISLDGTTGLVYNGQVETVGTEINENFATLMSWADKYRRLGIRANADNPNDARVAREFGAEGIGLCRTEHMFFDANRISVVREMILSRTEAQRRRALDKLLPMQVTDFQGIFVEMSGFPVTIRLLDPPLHEFLPVEHEEIVKLANEMGISLAELNQVISGLKEFNPMMGHRGCRLAVTYPEIAEMQTKAIIQAAINAAEQGYEVIPEIMIPLIGEVNELKYIKEVVDKTATKILSESKVTIQYKVGTMIEIPRAALTADVIAEDAEFFSFGTNDLTQMTYGFSRDDAGNFLNDYYDKKILEKDPFATIDVTGVGKLVEMSVVLGRKTRPNIKLGICGEHGGDPDSIKFFDTVGLDYVSCSPFRVPIARLAAARSAIKNRQ